MYGVGIDLGTSFAAAAVSESGALDMVRLSGPATVIPSAAYLDKNNACWSARRPTGSAWTTPTGWRASSSGGSVTPRR